MVAHVRTNCGYAGLIFGTIMANSPATVQSRLDVIDGHAYWQHPQFPGTPWDSVNWFVPNVSMVNTSATTTRSPAWRGNASRANPSSSPNTTIPRPIIMAAKRRCCSRPMPGLQDWDGLWLFDYGPGNDGTATMGYARGFFDTAQHPTKMANLLLAANLFRRGDVRPARRNHDGADARKGIDLLAKPGRGHFLFQPI